MRMSAGALLPETTRQLLLIAISGHSNLLDRRAASVTRVEQVTTECGEPSLGPKFASSGCHRKWGEPTSYGLSQPVTPSRIFTIKHLFSTSIMSNKPGTVFPSRARTSTEITFRFRRLLYTSLGGQWKRHSPPSFRHSFIPHMNATKFR